MINWDKLEASPPPPCPGIDMTLVPGTPAWLRREVQRLVDLDTPMHIVIALGLLVRLWQPPTDDLAQQIIRAVRAIPLETMRYVERRACTMAMALLEDFNPLDRDDLECIFAALCQRSESKSFGEALHALNKDLDRNRVGFQGAFASTVGEDEAERLAEVWHTEPMAWWSDPDTWP